MANFDIAISNTLIHEGANNSKMGYVNDPKDRGGETIAGIARNFHHNDGIWKLVDNAKKVPNFPNNLRSIPNILDMIKSFYRVNYWNKILGDDIKSQDIANMLLDKAVLEGYSAAIKRAQGIVGVVQNGIMTQELINRLNSL